ncbi:Retrovirus-related Pol polyprotein from transposon RE1 [Linum perenne]
MLQFHWSIGPMPSRQPLISLTGTPIHTTCSESRRRVRSLPHAPITLTATSCPVGPISPTANPRNRPLFPHTPASFPNGPRPAGPNTNTASPTSLLQSAPANTTDPPLQAQHTSDDPPHSPAAPPPARPPTHTHPMVTRRQTGSLKPKTYSAHTQDSTLEPTCFTVANKQPEWRTAMQDEFNALIHNHTWTLVPHPSPGHRVVGNKWVYRVKRHPDGTIARYKARLVAKGYHQTEGIDYTETFSPVIKPASVRLILSIALSRNWPIKQLDVSNAFLHGDLQETVYMSQPPGFVNPVYPNHVCLLKKSLYGLKQALRAWFACLRDALYGFGFTGSKTDHSLFYYNTGGNTIFVLVYVDDIIITSSNPSSAASLVQHLQDRFSIKELGDLHYFLGIEVHRTQDGMTLCQAKYIRDLLARAGMSNCKPLHTPSATTTPLSTDAPFHDPTLFRQLVGGLQYLSMTRPDLAYTTARLSQFMHAPHNSHWQHLKRALRYLQGTPTLGIHLSANTSHHLLCFTDADWGGDSVDRRSTTGYVIYLGSNIISWSSRKQKTVSRSSTEAEYRALATAASEALWLQSLLHEIGFPATRPPNIWCDNLSATYLSANPVFHSRSKHLEIDFHFVREQVAAKNLLVSYISTKDQIADALTKPLPTKRYEELRIKLKVRPSFGLREGNINIK